jgi:F-type H+-transporting ATPase subunit b
MMFLALVSGSGLRAGSEGPIDVDLDLTVFGQIAIFLVLLAVLKPLLFDPMLKLFEEREKRIEGARAEGAKLDKDSAEAVAKYEAAMQKARQEASAVRDGLRAEGARAEQEILTKVRTETGDSVAAGRATLANEVASTQASLSADAQVLAGLLASRALGREIA